MFKPPHLGEVVPGEQPVRAPGSCEGEAVEIRQRADADLEACITFLRAVHEQAGYPINWPANPRSWLTPPDALGCWVITVGTSDGTSSADSGRDPDDLDDGDGDPDDDGDGDLAGLGGGDRVVGHVAVTRDGPGRLGGGDRVVGHVAVTRDGPGRLGGGDRVVGHVAVTRDGPGRAFVERLFIDPAETGAGLGRRLLEHCVAVAAEHDLDLALEVADNCHAAIALYRRAGWQETRRTPISWGGTAAGNVIGFAPPIAAVINFTPSAD